MRHPLPYGFAKANSVLVEDDGQHLVLWAAETTPLTAIVTLRVRDTLKGEARGRFTFRQYLWDARDVYDAAGYRKGQDLLLLMIAPSRLGLSSPAGMGQGRFRIVRDGAGRELAINGTGNARLFDGLGDAGKPGVALSARQAALVAKHRGGPIAAVELAAMIRAFAGDR